MRRCRRPTAPAAASPSPARLGVLNEVPDQDRSDRDALWSGLRRDGYLLLRRALDPDDVLAFRRYYFEQTRESGVVDLRSDPALGIAGTGPVSLAVLRNALFSRVIPGEEFHAFCSQPAIRDWYARCSSVPTPSCTAGRSFDDVRSRVEA